MISQSTNLFNQDAVFLNFDATFIKYINRKPN